MEEDSTLRHEEELDALKASHEETLAQVREELDELAAREQQGEANLFSAFEDQAASCIQRFHRRRQHGPALHPVCSALLSSLAATPRHATHVRSTRACVCTELSRRASPRPIRRRALRALHRAHVARVDHDAMQAQARDVLVPDALPTKPHQHTTPPSLTSILA